MQQRPVVMTGYTLTKWQDLINTAPDWVQSKLKPTIRLTPLCFSKRKGDCKWKHLALSEFN